MVRRADAGEGSLPRRRGLASLGARLRAIGFAIAPPRPSSFTSAGGRAAYEDAYRDAVDALWPVSVASRFVETSFGPTHALVSGPADGAPLVLLHGAGLSAVSWYPNAARLASTHRIYALDSVFDSGLGRQTSLIRGRRDVARWLVETFDGLDLDRPAVAGLSQGGWAAASLARYERARASQVALLAPAATVQAFRLPVALFLRYSYLVRRGDTLDSSRRTFDMVFGGRFTPDDRFVRLAALGSASFRYARPPVMPTRFSDADLRAMDGPLLVLLPALDQIYSPANAFARARRLLPDAEVEMVPAAGHFVAMEAAERISERLLAFLGEQPTAEPGYGS
ncbi:MAG: alpha/beta fold hydrolase [Chloroflexota bacterium]